MAKLRKKGESGSKKIYINRDKAIKKLQLSIKDFRRLCIIKGIYPVEPTKKKKITRSSKKKTYYLTSDIRYLSNEPLVHKFWQFKSYLKRITKCKGRGDYDLLNQVAKTKPMLKFDHVIRERYPKFTDALRDLDDALCMCFLYANMTKNEQLPGQVIQYSRRLISEFMHYVIETRSLRKVFVSIKGIYFQAQIMGQEITFIVPHKFSFYQQQDIDYSVMRTFTEFYITLLGFANYKLLTSANFHYPPKALVPANLNREVNYTIGSGKSDKQDEYIACLNRPLVRSVNADVIREEENLDYFEDDGEYREHVQFTKLFEKFKFYLNREVPREALVFTIRSFGGQVSWDSCLGFGSSYAETDETITHQIVDRDNVEKKYLNRHYVQPQWIFDCVNNRKLLPIEDYFIGVELPPHLSPFVEEKEGEYVPPEKEALKSTGSLRVRNDAEEANDSVEEDSSDDDESENEEGEEQANIKDEEQSSELDLSDNEQLDLNNEQAASSDEEQRPVKKQKSAKKFDRSKPAEKFNKPSKGDRMQNEPEKRAKPQRKVIELDRPNMKVETGKVVKVDLAKKAQEEQIEQKGLAKSLAKPKHRRLLRLIERKKQHQQKELETLKSKRKQIDSKNRKKQRN